MHLIPRTYTAFWLEAGSLPEQHQHCLNLSPDCLTAMAETSGLTTETRADTEVAEGEQIETSLIAYEPFFRPDFLPGPDFAADLAALPAPPENTTSWYMELRPQPGWLLQGQPDKAVDPAVPDDRLFW